MVSNNSAMRRHLIAVRSDARAILAMIVGLDSDQATDVLAWALYGRTAAAATGIAQYAPTLPAELSDEYIEAQYKFADGYQRDRELNNWTGKSERELPSEPRHEEEAPGSRGRRESVSQSRRVLAALASRAQAR